MARSCLGSTEGGGVEEVVSDDNWSWERYVGMDDLNCETVWEVFKGGLVSFKTLFPELEGMNTIIDISEGSDVETLLSSVMKQENWSTNFQVPQKRCEKDLKIKQKKHRRSIYDTAIRDKESELQR